MANIIEARVKQKVATEAEWLTFDLIPLEGEQCFVKDSMGNNIGFKLGNGVARYSELPMWSTGGATYLSDLADVGSMSVSDGDLFSFVGGRWNAISGNTYAKANGSNASGTWWINISGSADKWGNNVYNGAIGPMDTAPLRIMGYDDDVSAWRAATPTALRLFQGSPSGGETLQSVTDRGNVTTNPINSSSSITTTSIISAWKGLSNSAINIEAIGDAYSEIQSSKAGSTYNHPLVLQRQGGNVGIGTTSPTEKLDVNGKGKFLGLDAGSELIVPTAPPSSPISGKTYLWVS